MSTSLSASRYTRPTTAQSCPLTRQSRPGTGRPVTGTTTRNEGEYIIALLEGRGIGREVGIAALNKNTAQMDLIQLSDCQTYVKTLRHLSLHNPSLVLVPDTFLRPSASLVPADEARAISSSLLVQYIREEFFGVPIEPVLRKHWNEDAGLQFLTQLCADNVDRTATLLAVSNKYYVLSAVCALFKYAELRENIRYASRSLRIRYIPVDGTMLIDNDSARNLELVGNALYKSSSHSLFGVLNHTWTPMGSRLLRVNILAPITAESSINTRLDAVEELIQNEELFLSIKGTLRLMHNLDLDKLIASIVASEARESPGAKMASIRVARMLDLRAVAKHLGSIRSSLEPCTSKLLQIITNQISDKRITRISTLIGERLNDEAVNSKNGGLNAMNSMVYAVKANYNCLLDVARETYKENVNDIFQLNKNLSDQHGLPVQLSYRENGFVFLVKRTDLEDIGEKQLPNGFINVTSSKGKLCFESIDLKKRNARMKDALDETLMLSDRIIQDLLEEIVQEVDALYSASEAVALLDMIWSFAHVAIIRNYTRPEFTGTLAIKSGRHPLLETVQRTGTVVPNDCYCCESSSFQIVHGPNMSGKSTYLRQIGLLTIMAMCGSFVPAEYGSFKIHDALLTRLSNDDDIERGLSTFAEEMSSAAMILGLCTTKTLVLVDELGRGTSPGEGLGISHSIAEKLIETKCFVFFATHFGELTDTLARCPSVVNLHLSIQKPRSSTSRVGLMFQYKILDGSPDEFEHYGLDLARFADLPADVMAESTSVAQWLLEEETVFRQCCEAIKISLRRRKLLKLRARLKQILSHSALPPNELLALLTRIQIELIESLDFSHSSCHARE